MIDNFIVLLNLISLYYSLINLKFILKKNQINFK